METDLSDKLLSKCATEEAWDILSEEFDWTILFQKVCLN